MTNEGSDPFTIFLFSTTAAEQIRDYCYVSDMADAFMLVAERGEGVYNAAGGSPTSIKHLAELMVSISPSRMSRSRYSQNIRVRGRSTSTEPRMVPDSIAATTRWLWVGHL